MASASFTFDAKEMRAQVGTLNTKLERALFATTRYWATRCERHMKHNAPWNDRTTNARNGLRARGSRLGYGDYAIILSHSVDYGIYLEVGTVNMDALPIIQPTIRTMSPKVMRHLAKLLDRI